MSWKVKLVFALACGVLLSGCIWYDVGLCKSTGRDYCDRRFRCTPGYANSTWGSPNECYLAMEALCEAADTEPGCDFADGELRSCQDAVGSACFSTHPGWESCLFVYQCY